jgi:uncharacterized protein
MDAMTLSAPPGQLPTRAGIGLRSPHLASVVASKPAVAWFEVHAENYMHEGAAIEQLDAVRRDYPLSVHGVGLSLGGAERPDDAHLRRLRRLIDRVQPALVSEHLSWSVAGGTYFNDLLPLPLTEESLGVVARNVDIAQAALGRRILIENPSSYLRFADSPLAQPDFLGALAARTGCGLLCDVNNIFVSAQNLGFDPVAYIDRLPAAAIGEFHLAGHSVNDADGVTVLIDDHGSHVSPRVWVLYSSAIARLGQQPTLIEWDNNLPGLDVLLKEAAMADQIAGTTDEERRHALAG